MSDASHKAHAAPVSHFIINGIFTCLQISNQAKTKQLADTMAVARNWLFTFSVQSFYKYFCERELQTGKDVINKLNSQRPTTWVHGMFELNDASRWKY